MKSFLVAGLAILVLVACGEDKGRVSGGVDIGNGGGGGGIVHKEESYSLDVSDNYHVCYLKIKSNSHGDFCNRLASEGNCSQSERYKYLKAWKCL